MRAIAVGTGANSTWLLTGEGPMMREGGAESSAAPDGKALVDPDYLERLEENREILRENAELLKLRVGDLERANTALETRMAEMDGQKAASPPQGVQARKKQKTGDSMAGQEGDQITPTEHELELLRKLRQLKDAARLVREQGIEDAYERALADLNQEKIG